MSAPDHALSLRYGGRAPVDVPEELWNETLALQLRHRSVRAFIDKPLPQGLLELLVAAGQSAASSSNMQTTSVIAVRDPARRARLAALCRKQDFIAEAPLLLCFVADLSRPARIGRAIKARLDALDMLDTYVTASTECGIFAQNVALAAESLGLGTCYLGNLKQEPEAVAAELGLPPAAIVLFGLCIGYEDERRANAIRPRLPQEIVVSHETYDCSAEPDHLACYDEIFAAHEVRQGRPDVGWSARHPDRFSDPDYLGNRAEMKAILRRLGFALR